VPIIDRDGDYETELLASTARRTGPSNWPSYSADIADIGFYSFVTSDEERSGCPRTRPAGTTCWSG